MYHDEMNAKHTLELVEKILEECHDQSMHTQDNASYHLEKEEQTGIPCKSAKKSVMKDWLKHHGLWSEEKDWIKTNKLNREDLWHYHIQSRIDQYPVQYKLVNLFKKFQTEKHKHVYLIYSPVRQCILQAIELFWNVYYIQTRCM